ncbi:DEAD/DEAH box helicase [Burkholderia stagnalis]|uniref:DEAD/DEAH box helicase n=2 Tax=Burkholderia stagnalis TaxID=1503054 RepID=A0ABX9YE23_9BURK|nr:DEAD/DEAH box helicase [Burkholderia stagnalis]RQQ58088.1 DEAD/DEAH box helicase [Burkholderia stagnalis]RQQ71568.1 DEAD/DEAH box helicase [Burkholderia stagnalis]RQQ78267.1 DEAD/DEAH box helicase [Burkholderia stagnalis]RQQ78518.1 DEAD/DEAH box helicase [Burkholderia stagnalis]
MNEGKPSHAGWENFTREELLAELARLHAENVRLTALLPTTVPTPDMSVPAVRRVLSPAGRNTSAPILSPDQKVRLFRLLFRGRTDVYPLRWESRNSGRSGYAPACANEWRTGICDKPRIRCADCGHRVLLALDDQVIYAHLAGDHTVGLYPLMPNSTCYLLAVDFDEEGWREDAMAFRQSCEELGVPVSLEISRSGNGAHAWIFFSSAVTARDARRMGAAIISHTCARTRQLELSSYDRLFPNQDVLPKGGFGNLIALPLQKQPRERGCSVFVDERFEPYADQWAYLAAIRMMDGRDIEGVIFRATGGAHPLDVTFIADEDQVEPWKPPPALPKRLAGPMPASLTLTRANQLYFEKEQLPQALLNRLIRLAAFQNPEFYRAQARGFSVWGKPRIIGRAENCPRHIALPRGCLDDVMTLLRDNDIACDLRDERCAGEPIVVSFAGTLRDDQQTAVADLLRHDTGILHAPTAFGKTVTAAAMIAQRGVNTLVLVHRRELLDQWRERLQSFLALDPGSVGTIGGGKSKVTGLIDVAMLQSVAPNGARGELLRRYGQVIVDECHHVSADSFEAVLKAVQAHYVLGLTATPVRRDSQQPVMFMLCGPIRHAARLPANAPQRLEVFPQRLTAAVDVAADAPIQAVFAHLAQDAPRSQMIATAVREQYGQGRNVLVLTERTDHLESLQQMLEGTVQSLFVLHGRLGRKARASQLAALDALAGDAPRVVLATGRLVGEGFDHPALDTLVLAMPVAWKGTLQQYAGRLHREHAGKTGVRVLDYVDGGHPVLLRMWDKRQRGYRAMGYQVCMPGQELQLTLA